MENNNFVVDDEVNFNDVINKLLQGRDALNRLHVGLYNNAPFSSSQENCEVLVNKVMSAFDNALCMLNHVECSPIECSEGEHEAKDSSNRKRKSSVWTDQIHVSPGSGFEKVHDDGYNWRKYGQKCILGAKFPKGYYRCTYRHSQGCLATKQIQKSNNDPTVFNIYYHGTHTCNRNNLLPLQPLATVENQEPNMVQIQEEETLLNLQRSLKVSTDNNLEDSLCDFASNSDANKFVSPGTSKSSCYFTVSPNSNENKNNTHVNNFGGNQDALASEAKMEIPIVTSSGTNSPIEFPFDAMDFDFNFTFDL